MRDENVLCISTKLLKEQFGLIEEYWACNYDALDSFPYSYVPRHQAETNASYKQIIPYVLVFDGDAKVLHYQRCGSEKRLSGLFSAGIGGHVNDQDSGVSVYEKIVAGLKREMKEELGLEVVEQQLQFLGMINEEKTEVGHCHLGVVFKVVLEDEQLSFESEISRPLWTESSKLDLSCFELWSALAIKLEQLESNVR